LEGNEVQDILEDRRGFMWFASKAGLVRYDGRGFKVYEYEPTDSTSISVNAVERIIEAKDGTLWVATWGGGLNHFDPNTEQFTHYRAEGPPGRRLSNDYVADLAEDQAGNIWIATRGGLNRLNPKEGNIIEYLPEANNPNSISAREIRTLLIDRNDVLWIGTGYPWPNDDTEPAGGLVRYNHTTDDFTRFMHKPDDPTSLINNYVSALFEDSDGNFWVGVGENQVCVMDRKKGTFRKVDRVSDWHLKDEIAHIRAFYEVKGEDGVWVLSYGAGLIKYSLEKEEILAEVWGADESGKSIFPLNEAWRIYQSSEGTVWICTGDIGEKVYKSSTLLPHLNTVYNGDVISSLAVDAMTGDIWLGRTFNGLNVGNWETNSFSYTYTDKVDQPWQGNFFASSDLDSEGLFDAIKGMVTCEEDVLWFLKPDGEGIYRLNKGGDRKQLDFFQHIPGNPESLLPDTLLAITGGYHSPFIWAVNTHGVLERLEQSSGRVRHFLPETYPALPADPRQIYATADGKIWVVGLEQGNLVLTEYDPSADRFEQTTLLKEVSTDLEVNNMTVGKDGSLWIGTDLYLICHPPDGTTKVHSLQENEAGRLRSFLVDTVGNIWLATSIGLQVFNVATGTFYQFSEHLQLQAQPFTPGAAALYTPEELLFCGMGGCVYVNKTTLNHYYNRKAEQATLAESRLRVAAFLLNGKEVKEGPLAADSIMQLKEIVIPFAENSFSLELSLLSYDWPEGHRFEYLLENYDTYWRTTGDRNNAYFARVPPGEYTLRIKGYNSVNAYAEMAPIRVVVIPPWWRTWWAYACYTLAGLGLLFAFYRFQLSRQLAKSEAQRLQELDVAKSQLYTNITHEFRTPLTVILGMTDQLSREVNTEQREVVEMIDRNGQNLLNLVNQLLDLAKLESGTMNLQLQQSDIISYLKYLVESFHSYAENRGVNIHFLSTLENQEMDFDPTKIQQIIANVLSNAIKFTPTGGDIYISVDPNAGERQYLDIRVKDTGAGISPEQLPHIFQRFYQADETTTREFPGTGIGLALVAELVKLMKGEIEARSEVGKGTEIKVRLPVEQSAEKNADLAYFEKAKIHFYREGVEKPEPEQVLPIADADRPSVLIVEDNFDVRAYIKACLKDQFQLLSAENGHQGFEIALEYTPDFIISDVMMPRKDGYTLAWELKNDQRTSHIPIILLTAKVDVDSRLEGLKQGVEAYLAKPFNPRELRLRIRKLLEQRKRLQQHYLSLGGQLVGVKQAPEATATAPEDEFVLKVKTIILARLEDHELDVTALCREVGMSQSQLHRKLSALTGLSPNRFLRHIRLEKAQELLKDRTKSVNEVAYEAGYKDPSYFGRVFKQVMGETPAEWRKGGQIVK
ncbi:MAG: ATP-binding protein, partial [Bacteroidota bacterium]